MKIHRPLNLETDLGCLVAIIAALVFGWLMAR